MKAALRTFGAAVTLAGMLVLGACGDDEEEPLPPVTSLFNGGSPDRPTATAPASLQRPSDIEFSDPEGSSTTSNEARARCTIDSRTLRTAQEAFYARNGLYASTDDELISQGFLSEPSELHRFQMVQPASPPDAQSTYNLIVADPLCGTPGHRTGQTPDDL